MDRRMTLKDAKLIARELGYSLTKRDDEYRANPIGGTEATAYYTNDLEDAIGTIRQEHARTHAS